MLSGNQKCMGEETTPGKYEVSSISEDTLLLTKSINPCAGATWPIPPF